MKSSRMKILLAVLAVLLLAAVAAFSQTMRHAGMRGGGPWGGRRLHFFARYLNLTDAQQAQIKQILAKEKPALQPLTQQMATGRHQLRQLAESGTFDEAQARTIAAQQSQAMTELMVQRTRTASELYQVLTPEQKTKFDQFMDKHEQRSLKHTQPESPSGE